MRSDAQVAWWTTATHDKQARDDAAIAADIVIARHAAMARERNAATQRIILRCATLIHRVAYRFRRHGCGFEDLMQEGAIGVMRAIEDFDPERGATFATYASLWIRSVVQRAALEHDRIVRVPARTLQRAYRASAQRRAFAARHGRDPETDELVHVLKSAGKKADETCDAADLDDAKRAAYISYAWLDAPAAGGNGDNLHDVFVDPAQDTAFSEDHVHLARLLEDLPEHQRDIIRAHFGIDREEETLGAIGERMGVTGEYVRRIEEKILELLRKRATRSPSRPPPAASRSKT